MAHGHLMESLRQTAMNFFLHFKILLARENVWLLGEKNYILQKYHFPFVFNILYDEMK